MRIIILLLSLLSFNMSANTEVVYPEYKIEKYQFHENTFKNIDESTLPGRVAVISLMIAGLFIFIVLLILAIFCMIASIKWISQLFMRLRS
ncbi:hypothetical protein YerA41_035 [Yersinia phage YerA41]|nr:hypothetical protein YerA41_035 [Yersinia phage YerA41]